MTAGNGFNGFMRRRTGLGVLAAAVLVCGLTLRGAPPDGGAQGEAGIAALLKTGHPVPVEAIPSGPTVLARRPDVLLRERGDVFLRSNVGDAGDILTATGGPTTCELDVECDDCNPCSIDTCIITLGVGACDFAAAAECNPCDDGTFCDGTDKCDNNKNCTNVSGIQEWKCLSGANEGKVCFNDGDTENVCPSNFCTINTTLLCTVADQAEACAVCDAGARNAEQCGCPGGGTCTAAVCDGGKRDGQACDCPGGACNTTDTCAAGDPGNICMLLKVDPDPCRFFPDLICDSLEPTGVGDFGACVEACNTDDDCNTPVQPCAGSATCVKDSSSVGNGGSCIGGATPGVPCSLGLDCGADCTAGGGNGNCVIALGDLDGLCEDGTFAGQPCAICGGVCRDAPERPCGNTMGGFTVTCSAGNPLLCGPGRCCRANGNTFDCTRATKADCEVGGGLWLGVGDLAATPDVDDGDDNDQGPAEEEGCVVEANDTFPAVGETFLCPKYSAGLISGNIVGIIGTAGAAVCNPFWEFGDDYNLSNCKVGNPSWYELLTMRWVGGHVQGRGSRMRISFYDADGRFVADRITGGAFPGGITRNTVVFDEKPIIPCAGFMTIKPAVSFSPDNQVEWAVTDTIHVGTTDSQMYARKHGFCAGDPDCPNRLTAGGCTPCNTDAECIGFIPATCTITSGVQSADDGVALKGGPLFPVALPAGGVGLAFELAGQKVPIPTGACCNLNTGNCDAEVPWICEGRGDFFQGAGSSCNVCSNDIFRGCDQEEDCHICDGGARDGLLCACPGGNCVADICDGGTRLNEDCDCPAPGICNGEPAFCLPVPPACQVTACCSKVDGACIEVTGNHCVGGPNNTLPCNITSECLPLGFCALASGTCDAGANIGLDCIGDIECPGGECIAPCPVGFNSSGFGTKCSPNCCVQIPDTGADTCAEAPIVVINVPSLGSPPVTFTWTSNNKAATFGDFIEETAFCAGGRCAGGDGTTACKVDLDCTVPGGPCEFTVACGTDLDCSAAGVNGPCIITGPGTCNAGRFDPAGGLRDRGWWHAFSIDDCADVRIDHCCTFEIDGQIHQPAWASIFLDCNPCTALIASNVVGVGSFPPDPIGEDTRAVARGGPFCDFDDLWSTYGPIPKGIYYYNTFSGTGGHFGEFQLHVTVGACATAACCLAEAVCVGPGDCPDLPGDPGVCTANICVGGANPGLPCTTTHGNGCAINADCAPTKADKVCTSDDANRPNQLCCPGGACDNDPVNPLCSGGTRAGLQCCDGGGECKGQCVADCIVNREVQCDALDGFWHGFGNIPLADDPALDCVGICEKGSCCVGPGDCTDDALPNCTEGENCCGDGAGDQFCIDRKACLSDNGAFVGGARCEHPKNPCPACEIEGDFNCHPVSTAFDSDYGVMSDLSAAPGGVVYADDVILALPQIDQVCVWGIYMDVNLPPTSDCSGNVVDKFRVRFYADDGNGKPDHTMVLAEAVDLTVANGGVSKSDTSDVSAFGPVIEVYTLTFPTMSLPTGVTIWLEVANNTDTPTGAGQPVANTCHWHWMQNSRRQSGDDFMNGWNYTGTDFRPLGPGPIPLPGGRRGLTGYGELGHGYSDMVFCLGNGGAPADFTEPDEIVGSCCNCENVCTDGVTFGDCYGENPRDGGSGDNNRWKRGGTCPDACLPPIGVLGDDCGSGRPGSTANIVDCTPPIPQEGNCRVIKDGRFEAQSVCASTSIEEAFPGTNFLGRDFFACYFTTATGKLFISMCNSGIFTNNMDSYLAVYHDFDNPTVCPCPTSALSFNTAQSDEDCNGRPDGGSGIVSGQIVLPGECWLARIGGWGNTLESTDRGIARVDIGVIASACPPVQTPLLQTQFTVTAAFGPPETKNRYIAIKGGGAGGEDEFVQQTIRIKWESMPNWPGGHLALNGRLRWITQPFQVCENSGQNFGPQQQPCGPSPGQPQKWFWVARTTGVSIQAWFGDLTKMGDYCTGSGESCDPSLANTCALGTCGTDGVIHIAHQNIVPSKKNPSQPAVYHVQAISDNCPIDVENSYSDVLLVSQPIFGDSVTSVATCPNGPPNGDVTVLGDVVGALNKFSNDPCAPKKTRVDLEPAVPDLKVTIADVVQALAGFSSGVYRFPADLSLPRDEKRKDRLHAGR